MTALAVNDEVRNAADVLLVVGSRLGETDWWGKAPNWSRTQQAVSYTHLSAMVCSMTA